MKKIIALLVFLSLVISPFAVVKASDKKSQSVSSDERVIVKMVDSKVLNQAVKFGATYLEKKSNLILMDKPKSKSMQSFLKEIRKNPKSEKAKKEVKHLKPFKQLMNDLLDTEYYKKHKEESIIKQFYT